MFVISNSACIIQHSTNLSQQFSTQSLLSGQQSKPHYMLQFYIPCLLTDGMCPHNMLSLYIVRGETAVEWVPTFGKVCSKAGLLYLKSRLSLNYSQNVLSRPVSMRQYICFNCLSPGNPHTMQQQSEIGISSSYGQMKELQ